MMATRGNNLPEAVAMAILAGVLLPGAAVTDCLCFSQPGCGSSVGETILPGSIAALQSDTDQTSKWQATVYPDALDLELRAYLAQEPDGCAGINQTLVEEIDEAIGSRDAQEACAQPGPIRLVTVPLTIRDTLDWVGDKPLLTGGFTEPDGWDYAGRARTGEPFGTENLYGVAEFFWMTFGPSGSPPASLSSERQSPDETDMGRSTNLRLSFAAAVVLGVIGLGLIGRWMRRFT
jgi:hypothetical protein